MGNRSRTVDIQDFSNNRVLTDLTVHGTDRYAAFVENRADLQENRWIRSLWGVDIAERSVFPLDLPLEVEGFHWDSDSDPIIHGKARGENGTSFFSLDITSRAFRQDGEIPFRALFFFRTKSALFFTARIRSGESTDTVACSERTPFFEEAPEGFGESFVGLFRCKPDGTNPTMVTAPDMNVDIITVDAARGRLLLSAFSLSTVKPADAFLYSCDVSETQLVQISENPYRVSGIIGWDEKTVIFFGVDLKTQYRNENPGLYRLDTASGTCRRFEPYWDISNEHPAVAIDSYFSPAPAPERFGDDLYFKSVGRRQEFLSVFAPEMKEGQVHHIDTGLTVIGSFHTGTQGILLLGMTESGLSELHLFRDGTLHRLTTHNNWLEDFRLSHPEKMTEAIDGIDIDGYVFPPGDPIPGEQTNPAVLLIHGGPKMIYTAAYSHDIQLLCARGYYVFCINPMGSDGRGIRFQDIRGTFSDLPYRQLMAFTDRVLERHPGIDPARLGVSGGSYGGFMTNTIITRTKRFAAAVSERSISNLLTFFSTSDIGFHFASEYLGQTDDRWAELLGGKDSPIHGAKNVSTPTLFIHGGDDRRCHYTESLNMYSALQYFGTKSKFCLFDGENHGLTVSGRPQSKVRRYNELLAWFDRFLPATRREEGLQR
jgi:dienelactone hydrolase